MALDSRDSPPRSAQGRTQKRAAVPNAAQRRRELYSLLGRLPDRKRPVSGKKRGEEERNGYVLETWDLDLNGIETVPAYLARPKNAGPRVPAILFNHSHGGGYKIGKQEFIEGRSYLQPKPYAQELTELGYVALCIDSWIFGERSHTSETDMFKAMLWQGQVLWGMMVYDGLRALDFLMQAPGVDTQRVGTLGMSMGSTMAWWLGALDDRFKVVVDINCLTEFRTLLKDKGLSRHGVYYFVPDLLNHFTTARDQRAHRAARAPRPRRAPRQPHAARGTRHHRRGAEARVRQRGTPRTLEASPVRRRTPGDRRRAAGHHRFPEGTSLMRTPLWIAAAAIAALTAQTPSPAPNPDSHYQIGPDSLPRDGVAKGEVRGPVHAAERGVSGHAAHLLGVRAGAVRSRGGPPA